MDFNNDCDINACLDEWNRHSMFLGADVNILSELIKIRDTVMECPGFTKEEISLFINDVCVK